MTEIDKEKEAFESWVRSWPNYAVGSLDRCVRYPDYYASIVIHGAWEGWLARARSERVVSVGELEALCDEWQRGSEEPGMHAMGSALRALIAKADNVTNDVEALARKFHETYESLAHSFGYETRPETREFDPESPNGRLMIAVCAELTAQNTRQEKGK